MSRFLRSETYKKNLQAGTITVGEFGTAPEVPPAQKGFFSKWVLARRSGRGRGSYLEGVLEWGEGNG